MNIIRGAISGEYALRGYIEEADCAIGQSFGSASDGIGVVNDLLGEVAINEVPVGTPLLMQQEIANAIQDQGSMADFVIKGDPSTILGAKLDSWSVLSRAKEHMDEQGYESPILIAQAYQVERLARQAIKLGMNPIVIEGMPREFDRTSSQIWTRSRALWAVRELPGIPYLMLRSKL